MSAFALSYAERQTTTDDHSKNFRTNYGNCYEMNNGWLSTILEADETIAMGKALSILLMELQKK